MGTLGWSHPKRTRKSVQVNERHLGYVTTIAYPNRDITALLEGLPFSEIVIADPREEHVALLQRFKEHWLIQCGESYGTADRGGELSDAQVLQLALFALQESTTSVELVQIVAAKLNEMLGSYSES